MLTINEISAVIAREQGRARMAHARKGVSYYKGHHDIEQYRVYYYDNDGNLKEDKSRSNIKISHPFFMELVDQTVQYMLSGARKTGIFKSEIPELQKMLNQTFGDDFLAELASLLTGQIVKGSEYMYLFEDTDSSLKFKACDSMGIAEVRDKETDDVCQYVVRWYVARTGKNGQKIKKIEVWDKHATYFYLDQGSGIILDPNAKFNPRPHVIFEDGGEVYGSDFGFIPFFRLDLDEDRESGLMPIKALIDDYDMMSCSLSNNLEDLTEGLYVVKGYPGTDVPELIQNIKARKAIGVDPDGDVDIKTVQIPYEARKVKMELDRENIYKFGMGFDSGKVGDGNVTNVVIKSRYSLLDLKCTKLEIRLRQFLTRLLEIVLNRFNKVLETSYTLSDIKIEFNRETITNDTDNAQIELVKAQTRQTDVNTILNLNGILDGKLALKKICEIAQIDYNEASESSILTNEEDAPDTSLVELDKDAAEETIGRPLNGAQTQSMLSVLEEYRNGTLSESQASKVLALALGISREKATELIKEN